MSIQSMFSTYPSSDFSWNRFKYGTHKSLSQAHSLGFQGFPCQKVRKTNLIFAPTEQTTFHVEDRWLYYKLPQDVRHNGQNLDLLAIMHLDLRTCKAFYTLKMPTEEPYHPQIEELQPRGSLTGPLWQGFYWQSWLSKHSSFFDY